jgi:hypothetical protein
MHDVFSIGVGAPQDAGVKDGGRAGSAYERRSV